MGLHLLGLMLVLAIVGNLLECLHDVRCLSLRQGRYWMWPSVSQKILGLHENQELHLKPSCGSADYCISSCLGHSSFTDERGDDEIADDRLAVYWIVDGISHRHRMNSATKAKKSGLEVGKSPSVQHKLCPFYN